MPVEFDADFLALAARDDHAFATLREQFHRLVWSSSYGFGFDQHTRDDIAQLVWLKLYQHLDSIRDPARLAGWLATTTRRECLRTARARARTIVVDTSDDRADSGSPDLDASLIRDETIRAVAVAMDAIDADCRRLLRMLTLDPPLSYEEISNAIQAPMGSIGPWRQRCLRKLAAKLQSAGSGS